MNPIDEFYFLKNNLVERNSSSLSQLYLPIIGQDAYVLYDYLVAFFDNGLSPHKFSEILNHTEFNMPRFNAALDVLTAINLVSLYKTSKGYLIQLLPALGREEFLATSVFKLLLEKKIGQVAVEELVCHLPQNAQNLSKRFSDVFTEVGDLPQKRSESSIFDLEHFKALMQKNGLQFHHEQDDSLAIVHFAEKHNLNWFSTFKIAQETAINGMISLDRMKAFKENRHQTEGTSFTAKEQVILREAKQNTALDFLIKIKKTKKAVVTRNEENILKKVAEMGFLDEVINIMTLYTLNKTDSANLNQSYLVKIANDFSYRNISTAELAILHMRSDKPVAKKKKVRQNIPTWADKEFKTIATDAEKAQLEALKKSMLED